MYLEHQYGGPAYYWQRGEEYGTGCETCVREVAEWAGLEWQIEGLWQHRFSRQLGYAGEATEHTAIWPITREETDTPESCDFCGDLVTTHLTEEGVRYLRDQFPRYVWDWYGVDDNTAGYYVTIDGRTVSGRNLLRGDADAIARAYHDTGYPEATVEEEVSS